MPEKLSAWPEIQKRLVEYISAVTGDYGAFVKISKRMTGMGMAKISAKTSEEKDGLKVITTRGKGTFVFWVKPIGPGDRPAVISIVSEKGIAPLQVYNDLIKPTAEMLRKETSVQVELKITPR